MEFEIREENIDGVEKWLWPKIDTGLWHGPMLDWRNSHKQKIMKWVNNFNVVVQAGGGAGMYPRLLSNIFDVVYTFEPCETSFHCLEQNTLGRKIVRLNAAVGATWGLISTDENMEVNQGMNKIEERANSYIPRMPIDSIPYRDCNLLWLDVEGYEQQALEGAMETIHKFNPVIFAERGDYVEEWINRLGYIKVDESVADKIFIREKPPNP